MDRKRVSGRGPKGLAPQDIIEAALMLIARVGAEEFSVRKLAGVMGCNPMAILYHFGSKTDLNRAMVETINAELVPPASDLPWKTRLREIASQFRALAAMHPNVFPMLADFYVSGPADVRNAEHVYRALLEAGLPEGKVAHLLLGFYALVIGLCAAEIRGLLSTPPADKEREVSQLISDAQDLWATRKLMPFLTAAKAEDVFWLTLDAYLDGLQPVGGQP